MSPLDWSFIINSKSTGKRETHRHKSNDNWQNNLILSKMKLEDEPSYQIFLMFHIKGTCLDTQYINYSCMQADPIALLVDINSLLSFSYLMICSTTTNSNHAPKISKQPHFVNGCGCQPKTFQLFFTV